ncbi:hypothetical protein Gorai_014810 [Gossypium raimondii]|uniref:Uncharacterized protein n=1 Tax=Gossypium raimondii TaxID=29730 RepID=A0A7J8P3Z8_GOSRA|nr:hypothetical protein [Gossypium raimondii]PPD71235.1 hypothetical protein GOBAR_DD31884 [Gossypium barbadense]
MIESQTLHPAFQPGWDLEDIRLAFFKCTRWQVEETLDPINCPFHYFCDSVYPGHYPQVVDILVLLLATASYLATLVIMLIDISRRGRPCLSQSKRLFLPSGPLSLPLILLALAKGSRINILYPFSCIAPAILQLVQISSLAFDNGVDKDPRYAFLEASTISGILHASVYLDSIILPYYTGIDALASSTFSGECLSCMCRKQDRLQTVNGEQSKNLNYQVPLGEFSLDLDHQRLRLSGGEHSGRTTAASSCCFWWHTAINLPSWTQGVMHSNYAIAPVRLK